VDIVASRDELGFEPPILKVQVKAVEGSIGSAAVVSLFGSIGNGEFGLFVTLRSFMKAAQAFGKDEGNLPLIDRMSSPSLIWSAMTSLMPSTSVFCRCSGCSSRTP
jgi:restriction system protein